MKNIFKMFGTQIRRLRSCQICAIAFVAVIGFSMAACIDLNDNGLPAPTGLTATAVSSSVINLTWNAVAGASGYKVYQSQSSSSGFNLLGTVSTNSASNNNLPANTTLYYKVSAYKANGDESAMSSVASATTPGSYSLDGTWATGGGTRVTVSGSTGVFTAFGSSHALAQDAINKGYIHVGDTAWRNLRSTGDRTWSGQMLMLEYTSSPNVCTGTRWVDYTFTMSSDGRTLSAGGSTWTRQ